MDVDFPAGTPDARKKLAIARRARANLARGRYMAARKPRDYFAAPAGAFACKHEVSLCNFAK